MRMLLLSMALIFIAVATVGAQGWRGIVPLHTSRIKVEQLIGRAQVIGTIPTYDFDTERVEIFYSKYPCGNPLNFEQWNVPPDTVFSIVITPKQPIPLADLQVDLSKFTKQRISFDAPKDYSDLVDYENGLTLSLNSQGNLIRSYRYGPRKSDSYLHCPGYSEDQTSKECIPLAFAIDCSSEQIKPGIPVECKFRGESVENAPMKFNWTVSSGASQSVQDDKVVKIMLTDLTQSKIKVTLRILSPNVCLDTASTQLTVVNVKDRPLSNRP